MKKTLFILFPPFVTFLSCTKSTAPSKKSTDVYVVGYTLASNNNYVAAIWKNSVETKPTDSTVNYYATAISAQGADVYVAGYSLLDNGNCIAMYWKNGVAVKLGDVAGNATGISVVSH